MTVTCVNAGAVWRVAAAVLNDGGGEGCIPYVYAYHARPISHRRLNQTDVLTANLSLVDVPCFSPLPYAVGTHETSYFINERPPSP